MSKPASKLKSPTSAAASSPSKGGGDKAATSSGSSPKKALASEAIVGENKDVLGKRLTKLHNVADQEGLREAGRVLDLCGGDPLMLKIMEERVHNWESDVHEMLPEQEKDKFVEAARNAHRDSDDDQRSEPALSHHRGSDKRGSQGGAETEESRGGQSRSSQGRQQRKQQHDGDNSPQHVDEDEFRSVSEQSRGNVGAPPPPARGGGPSRTAAGAAGSSHQGRALPAKQINARDVGDSEHGESLRESRGGSRNQQGGYYDDDVARGRNGDDDRRARGGRSRDYYGTDDEYNNARPRGGGNDRGDGGRGQGSRGGRGDRDRDYDDRGRRGGYDDRDADHGRGGDRRRDADRGRRRGSERTDHNDYRDSQSRSRTGGGGGDDGYSDGGTERTYPPAKHGGKRHYVPSVSSSRQDTGSEYFSPSSSEYEDSQRGGRGRDEHKYRGGFPDHAMADVAAVAPRSSRKSASRAVDPNHFEPVDRQTYETARQRLVDFYAMVNPEKVGDVDKILQAFNGDEEKLFQQLHIKYVDSLRNRLDEHQREREEELLARARALGTDLPPPPPPPEIKLAGLTVEQLIEQGNALMASAPEPPLMLDRSSGGKGGGNRRGAPTDIPLITGDHEVVSALEALHATSELNIKLVQEVAVAEQSVLQSRFRVILSKCLKAFNNAPNHLLVINDMHGGKEFQVALSDAVWAFLREAVLDTPLLHATSVRVSVSSSHTGGTTQVDRNILAAALREWSAQCPHTVAQRMPDRGSNAWKFETSRTAWWTWPSMPSLREAVPGRSMIYPTVHRETHRATNLNDASFPSLRDLITARSTISGGSSYNGGGAGGASPATSAVADRTIATNRAQAMHALYDPRRHQPGYVDHLVHHMAMMGASAELSEADRVLRR